MNMRTTLALEDEATEAVQGYARDHGVSLGKAASELIRRGTKYQLGIKYLNGLPVLDAGEDFPLITTEQVSRLLDE
jgi:hypothetical protein